MFLNNVLLDLPHYRFHDCLVEVAVFSEVKLSPKGKKMYGPLQFLKSLLQNYFGLQKTKRTVSQSYLYKIKITVYPKINIKNIINTKRVVLTINYIHTKCNKNIIYMATKVIYASIFIQKLRKLFS